MTVWRLVCKEIAYRRLNFALGLAAVAVAVGCLVAEATLLRADAERTRRALFGLEDDVREITKRLGYNVLIVHKDQDLRQFYRDRCPTHFMLEGLVDVLAGSKVVTVQHLLPTLREEIEWDEQQKYPIILMGTRGEVPLAHRDPKKPLLDPVPPGSAIIGHRVHKDLGLPAGADVTLRGEALRIARVQPPRNTEDDFTVWIHLRAAQNVLRRPGRINAILALSCFCKEAEDEGIAREITRILPDTQVIVLAPQEAARREARARAAAHGDEVRRQREAFAAWVLPIVIVGCTVWVGLLALGNVRERCGEIGILRALGLRGRQVFALFLARALVVGLVGAAAGYAGGLAVGGAWDAYEAGGAGGLGPAALFSPALLIGALLLAPLLAALASLMPALVAARQDPAIVLREG